MTLASIVGPVAAACGVFMALSPLLQARRVRALGDSSEVSAAVFLMMRVNASSWLTYGIASGNLVIVVPNVLALTTTTWTLHTIRRCRSGHASEATRVETRAPAPAADRGARPAVATIARTGALQAG